MPEAAAKQSPFFDLSSSEALLTEAAAKLASGALIPYLGPGVFPHADAPAPLTPEAVAHELHKRAPAPGRIRGNMWSVAQFVEQRRHRKTLVAFMTDIFGSPVPPASIHKALALSHPPLIIDSWYDGAMRAALAGLDDWAEIQGVTRALEFGDIWFRAYDAMGEAISIEQAARAKTILYKPHGAVTPSKNFLVADSDYVEVLTEIDLQTPIPDAVKDLRRDRGFIFIGCRFHDQMLRTYARQIAKRSAGPHYVLLSDETLTRNEWKFFEEIAAAPIAATAEALAVQLTKTASV